MSGFPSISRLCNQVYDGEANEGDIELGLEEKLFRLWYLTDDIWSKAVQTIKGGNVRRVVAKESGRTINVVKSEGKKLCLVLQDYCSCTKFSQGALKGKQGSLCPHQLAVILSQLHGSQDQKTVSDQTLSKTIRQLVLQK